ncbi:hypothetical protein PPERSA_03732 [Pseudocohnilembus persalinus]|uniref:Uncharacterized protein n=1 Tax=Pseudocohnilembus persalinus TaxID=266149 RepID=A0A0V0QHW9_PSEPJ|nr:hypothetical protein PPERSA_03732 [Pseudocohnilembus persalinus]|eukprot:KRX01648.1 hypothetical protein PPERSA_03732 [Pseudocohnilembus persalinus]
MSESLKEKGYQEFTPNTDSIKITPKTKLYLFQVPKDFDPKQLNGKEIDLKSLEQQEIDDTENLVCKQMNENTIKHLKTQLHILYAQKNKKNLQKCIITYKQIEIYKIQPINSNFSIGKSIKGGVKIFKTFAMPKIQKKAIIKTKPFKLSNQNQNEEEDE